MLLQVTINSLQQTLNVLRVSVQVASLRHNSTVVNTFVWTIHLSCCWYTKVNKDSLKTKYVFMCFVEELTRGHKELRVAL